jgi:preprotein translocase subunit YajC
MNNSPTTIVFLVLALGLVLLMFRNSRKRKQQQTTMVTKMIPGARVMLSFGMYGTIVSVNDEKVTADVEVAPGTVVTVHRQTLSRVVDEDGSDVVAGADGATTVTAVDEPAAVIAPVERTGEPEFGERTARPEFGERTDHDGIVDPDAGHTDRR